MGQLPGAHTTGDVDTIQFRAAKDRDVVLDTAAQVGRELSLPLYWMNDVSGLFAWTLPDGWEERRQKICEFGSLIVYTVSRLDLIAMKFMAHRPADFEHLQDLNVTSDEVEFVHSYLDNKELGHPEHSDQIALARSYLSNWL